MPQQNKKVCAELNFVNEKNGGAQLCAQHYPR